MALNNFQLNDYILQTEQPEGLLPPYLEGRSYARPHSFSSGLSAKPLKGGTPNMTTLLTGQAENRLEPQDFMNKFYQEGVNVRSFKMEFN